MSGEIVILVVDDQPDLLSSIELTLEAVDYRVVTANDGIEALELLQKQPVDLILADIAMPRMNGYQLFERVRENPDWNAVPFLFLTARTLDSDVRYGKGLGVDDYLTKPIQPEDLIATVQGKLRRAQQLSQMIVQPAAPPTQEERALTVGVLRVDADQHRAWFRDEILKLSAREFVLLEHMARRVNTVVSPQEIIALTHDLHTDYEEASTLLRPLVRSLRRKLGYATGETGCIEVVRGVGYRLITPE